MAKRHAGPDESVNRGYVEWMLAQSLNENCFCTRSDRDKLGQLLQAGGLVQATAGESALFAEFPVFIDEAELAKIVETVHAIQEVTKNAAFVEHALQHAPAIAAVEQGPKGVVYGYDFHLTANGPRLIEVNTNAGGLLLNDALCRAQSPCCEAVSPLLRYPIAPDELGLRLVNAFKDEFRRARGDVPLKTVAIVDDDPTSQFLYPEFQLFATLFAKAGIQAWIADPSELEFKDGKLWRGDATVDLVYNRLTDFYLEMPSHAHLAEAYVAGAFVLTPHPRAHALFANKRHLATWSDARRLGEWGVDASTVATLTTGIPRAEIVTADNRERLWNERKRYFFKPACGYAGKAAYRGDKITKSTWSQNVTDGYLAQELVRPSERAVRVDGQLVKLKLDVRAYVDQERVVLLAARLYQGQTTNFRTPGGGFATVLAWPGGSIPVVTP